ncbi:MAG: tetratricopeptide repeat protein [Candidatus Electrothrix sp. GM3_4]|nr:tetratricopeptide repeat protein [Candidatus Electrothrix sp. GM3_4]
MGLRIAGRYLSSTGESAATYLRFLSKMPFKRLGSGEHQDENAALLLRRSVEQVSADAVQVLRLVGVLAFASIDLEPVMAVSCQDGEDPNEAELRSCDALNQLVTYGLLEKEKERWKVSHALIHTYARKELALDKEALQRLAAYYIEWCEAQSAAGKEGYIRLDSERAHCLRLIKTCLNSELWEELRLLVGAIYIYLDRQGYWAEQMVVLEVILTAARQSGEYRDQGVCLNNLGLTCWRRGEHEKGLAWFKQSLPIWYELGDKQREGITLNNIALIYKKQGKYEQALQQYEQSLSIKREVGDRQGEGVSLNNIGMVYNTQGDYETALQYYAQALPIL